MQRESEARGNQIRDEESISKEKGKRKGEKRSDTERKLEEERKEK